MTTLANLYAADDQGNASPFVRGAYFVGFLGMPDDTNDNTALLQAAIDSLPANGGEIRFPAGTFAFDGRILWNKSNIRLVGAGGSTETGSPLRAATKLHFRGTAVDFFYFDPAAVIGRQGAQLENLGIMADGTTGKIISVPDYPNGCPGGTLRNVLISSAALTGTGIYLGDGSHWDLNNVHVDGFAVGVNIVKNNGATTLRACRLLNSATNLVIGNTQGISVIGGNIEGATTWEVDMDGSGAIFFLGVYVETGTGTGSKIRIGSVTRVDDVRFIGCYFAGNNAAYAFEVWRIHGLSIQEATFVNYITGIVNNVGTDVANISIGPYSATVAIINSNAGVVRTFDADGSFRFSAPTDAGYVQVDLGTPTAAVRNAVVQYGSGMAGNEITGVARAGLAVWKALGSVTAMLLYAVGNVPIIFGVNNLEAMRLDGSNGLQLSSKFFPAVPGGTPQTAAALWAGTGVPNNANGSNGHYYFRSDGGVGTSVYFKSGGAWAGIL